MLSELGGRSPYGCAPFLLKGQPNMKAMKKVCCFVLALGLLALALAAFLWCAEEGRCDIAILPRAVPSAEDAEAQPPRQIDWDALPEEVVAWVEVPGTSIDEPIAQATADCPDRYLYEDALEGGAYGTPYIDWECSVDSRFVMVYGHHMSDGSVFADFARFIDAGYANGHDRIIVYKRSGEVLNLHPAAVDVVNASCESLVIDQEADFRGLVDEADLKLMGPAEGDQLFAFATCSYQTADSRTIVLACEEAHALG